MKSATRKILKQKISFDFTDLICILMHKNFKGSHIKFILKLKVVSPISDNALDITPK